MLDVKLFIPVQAETDCVNVATLAQPFAFTPLTVYVVVTDGLTTITVLVELVLHV